MKHAAKLFWRNRGADPPVRFATSSAAPGRSDQERRGQLVWLEGAVRAVSLYIDDHHMISTALAVLSLTQPGPRVERDAALPMEKGDGGCHPRYRCEDHMEYIAGHALPHYIAGRGSG